MTLVGSRLQSWTIRGAGGYDWRESSASSSEDGQRLAFAYHGPDTSGADVIDLAQANLVPPCVVSKAPFLGCSPDVHGAIEPYGEGWLATTGTGTLVLLDAEGHVLRSIDSGFENEHLMSLAIDRSRGVAYSLATCYYGREGLRAVSIATGTSRLVRRAPCGNDLTLGPSASLLAVESSDANAGTTLIAVSRSTGRVLLRRRFAAYIVAAVPG